MNKLFTVVWPAFMIAVVAEFLFVLVIDPQELYLFGQSVKMSNVATYSIGVFAFFLVAVASSLGTWYLMRSPRSINRESERNTTPNA
jgi:hypothetical protein